MFEDETVRIAVNKLSEPKKTIIIMYYSGKFTMGTVAGTLGISLEKVKQLHEEALIELRKEIRHFDIP